MYNPAMAPYVHHCTGTDLVVEHIEKHWCPTITSVDLLGGKEFRFSEDKRPTIGFVIAEDEYKTERTLPEFAAKHLGKDFRTLFAFGSETSNTDIPGLEMLKDADVLFVSARRRVIPKAQLDHIRAIVAAGKPVVGIRTASHAFSPLPRMPVPEGLDAWTTFDPEILGGHYTTHTRAAPGAKVVATVAPGAANHPILAGVDVAQLIGNGTLYIVSPLEPTTTPLLIGTIQDKGTEPIAWTNAPPARGKVFYTSLGDHRDFEEPAFNQLLLNAVRWAVAK
jgi:type 1 glutamine amidotransferase